MKSLTLLSFQAFVIALLCSSAFTEERAATLDELIKALGSLYQQKLFAGDKADRNDDMELIIGGVPVEPVRPELRETVTVPRYHYCMKAIPYCVTFYGSIIVQDKFPIDEGLEKKHIRNTQDQLCLKDIKLGTCSDAGMMGDYKELVNVSGLEIPDFCFPGDIKLKGTVEFFDKITSDAMVHVQMNPRNVTRRSGKYYEPASCSQIGYFYNVCDLLDRSGYCLRPRNIDPEISPLPCICDIEKGVYSVDTFSKTVDKVDFFGMGERSGFAVVTSGEGRSCFSFNFTGVLGSY